MTSVKVLRAAVEAPLVAGLYTHAYAAYGRLDMPAPTHEVLLSPDGCDVFDLASLTKALVTTPLVFAEVQAERLTLDHAIGDWLGAAGKPLDARLRALTVRALLRHESGLPAWRNFWVHCLNDLPAPPFGEPSGRHERLLAGLNRAAAALPSSLNASPSVYSDVGFLLLGLALELRAGQDLSRQFEAFCQSALGLDPVTLPLVYAASTAVTDRAVPTSYCRLRGRQLKGEVHDENTASLGGVTAHGGLFGTGRAVGVYLHALARSAVGALLLAENAAARRPPPNAPLLGWRQGADPSSETFGGGGAIGHLGFVGTAFWLCPDRRDYAIFLTNRVASGRVRPEIVAARRDVFAALAGLRS